MEKGQIGGDKKTPVLFPLTKVKEERKKEKRRYMIVEGGGGGRECRVAFRGGMGGKRYSKVDGDALE